MKVLNIIANALTGGGAGCVLYWFPRAESVHNSGCAVPEQPFQPLATGRRARAPGAPPLPALKQCWFRDEISNTHDQKKKSCFKLFNARE